jgi:hypothetical protein
VLHEDLSHLLSHFSGELGKDRNYYYFIIIESPEPSKIQNIKQIPTA